MFTIENKFGAMGENVMGNKDDLQKEQKNDKKMNDKDKNADSLSEKESNISSRRKSKPMEAQESSV